MVDIQQSHLLCQGKHILSLEVKIKTIKYKVNIDSKKALFVLCVMCYDFHEDIIYIIFSVPGRVCDSTFHFPKNASYSMLFWLNF